MKRLLALLISLAFLTPAVAQVGITGAGQASLTQCGSLKGANLNTTADQQINFTAPSTLWVPVVVRVQNASAAVNTAVGGIYSAPSKGGTVFVSASQAYSGLTSSAPNTAGDFINLSTAVSATWNLTTLYFSLTTPEGSAKTADIYIYCYPAS